MPRKRAAVFHSQLEVNRATQTFRTELVPPRALPKKKGADRPSTVPALPPPRLRPSQFARERAF